ncbi:MarR family winged helix-turn-helix transcriptional regulator [Aeromicrobium alkaliterrae]|uniref:MarR family transcriptional regulator n=1 Tax=Aeromicrobium alkaliterrae TaxID=302168 RepID=A0ABN2JT89_9ACTN
METTTDTQWLGESQQRVWRSFLGATTLLMDRLDRDLRNAHDLSMPEYEILVRLSESPDRSIRMAELAAQIMHSRSRVTHTITRLERKGIVLREQAASDGRGVTAVLTDHGFSVLERAAHTHVNGVRAYLVETASPEEFDVLGQVMARVVSHLDVNGTCATP